MTSPSSSSGSPVFRTCPENRPRRSPRAFFWVSGSGDVMTTIAAVLPSSGPDSQGATTRLFVLGRGPTSAGDGQFCLFVHQDAIPRPQGAANNG